MNPEQPSLFDDSEPDPSPSPPSAPPSASADESPWAAFPAEEDGEAGPEEESGEGQHEVVDEPAGFESAGLADWKEALRLDFENWLAGLEEIPERKSADAGVDDVPDLYSFHEQLAAANAESRKANRRTAEAISQWGETLAQFESSLGPLRETVAQLGTVPKEGELGHGQCLVLVELLDRLHRLADAFGRTPAKRSWWRAGDTVWRQAWAAQSQGFTILVSHVEEWLKKEGVERIEALGRPFDPAVMMAVESREDPTRPSQTVLEETAAGYLRRGELLRPAQVKVSRRP